MLFTIAFGYATGCDESFVVWSKNATVLQVAELASLVTRFHTMNLVSSLQGRLFDPA